MTTRPSLLLAAAAVAVAAFPADAGACSVAGPTPHVVDPAMQATDQVAPTLPALPAAQIKRGKAPMQSGCDTFQSSSCDDVGIISITAPATDDITPPDRIGYRLTLESGVLPSGLTLPIDAVVSIAPGELFLAWADGASDDQEPFAFTLRIVAVDLAGNESPPQLLTISDDRGSGCSVGRGGPGRHPLAGLVLALALLATRRRRAPGGSAR